MFSSNVLTVFSPNGFCGHAMKCHARQMQNSHIYDFTEIQPLLNFLYTLESTLSAQFQGEISQSNVKCNKFYKQLKLISYSPTITVKSVGKVAVFNLFFFPSSLLPWPNVEQNVNVCARNCSV